MLISKPGVADVEGRPSVGAHPLGACGLGERNTKGQVGPSGWLLRILERKLEQQQVYDIRDTSWLGSLPRVPSSLPSFMALMFQYAAWVTLLLLHEDPGFPVLSPSLPHSGQPASGGSQEAQPKACLQETTMGIY